MTALAPRRTGGLLACLALALGALLLPAPKAHAATGALVGTFRVAPASCSGAVSGSVFRMILPSGGLNGPYLSNSDSSCSDQTVTPLRPGTDGGLVTGSYQQQPTPPFDSSGAALARRITAPAPFYGTAFATATNPVDPQTSARTAVPEVTVSGTTLTADLRAFAVTWNSQHFQQGSPKPDGSRPGNTRPATGTYDEASGRYTLDWTSQIVGGPFDKFTGKWHLEGVFVPAAQAQAPVAAAPAVAPTSAGRPAATAAQAAASGAAAASAVPSASTAAPPSAPPSTSAVEAGAPQAAAEVGAQPVAAVRTTRQEHWQVSWWLVAGAAALALAGFGTLARLQRALARAEGGA